ncbi:MAG: zinc-binding alcohol dehydrogenase family protein [Eubacteriales bacterium]
MDNMKIFRITEPGKTELIEGGIPTPGENEALLRVRYCGVCGADVASFTGNQPFTTYPRIPGHEFSAEIAALPDGYKGGLAVGDIVTANPYFNCGSCYSCRRGHINCCTDNRTMGVQRDGSFSQYITMPVGRIYGGRGLDAKLLALVEPFSIGWHALHRAPVKAGDRVLIIGAGPIGLFALISAKRLGARVYCADLLDGRLDKAKAFGADGVVNTKKTPLADFTQEVTGGDGFDVCVEACGAPETFLAAIDCAAFAANIILIGNGKRPATFVHSVILKKELNIFGSRNSLPEDFTGLIDYIAEGNIDLMKLVSGIYPIDRADEAFAALTSNDGSLCKLLIEM